MEYQDSARRAQHFRVGGIECLDMTANSHGPALRDLLDHSGWLRALAYSLVSDPSVAEDAVQDTWVAALERPPDTDENVRGWLATVVRNAVRIRGRAASRSFQTL